MPPSRNQNRKSRSRQTTLKFASSPLPPSGSELRSTTVYPSSPTRPHVNKPSQPRDAFQAIMPNSSPIPRKTRTKSPIILDYSDSDSEGSTSVLWRSGYGKRKRGVIGIAESRSGVSAGFFGGGLSQGRSKKIGVGRGEESDDEEDDSDKPAVSKKNIKSIEAEEDERESEDEELKKTIRGNKMQRRVKQEPKPVLENIRVASRQVNGRTPTKKLTLVDESDEGEESVEELRSKTLIRGRKKARKSADDEEEEQLEPKRGRKGKGKEGGEENGKDKHKGKGKQEEVIRIQSDTEEDDVIALPTRPRERNNPVKAMATPKKRSYISPDREEDGEDEEEDDVRPAGKRGKFKHRPVKLAVEEADEGERVPAKSGSPQVTQAMKDKVKRWMIESGDDEQNEPRDLSDSSVRIPPRRGHRKAAVEDSDEGEDGKKESKWRSKFTDAITNVVDLSDLENLSDPQPIPRPRRKQKPPPISNLITPSRHRRLVPAGKSSPVPATDDSDLGSDTELAARTPVLNSRTRYGDSTKKPSAYQRKLQQLKAKREGVDLESSDDDDEMEPRRALYDSDDGLDNVQLEDEEEEEEQGDGEESIESEIRELEPHRRQKSPRRHDGELDSDIDSFIVTDSDSDPLGAPDALNGPSGPIARIPIQFTSQSHASLKIHFKTVVQYILNLLLNPAFPKNDEYFTFALHAIDRRVDSFRDSVLKSEAWKSDFMLALKSRPGFEFDPNGGDGFENHCMACNRRDRNASYTVRFTGRRYDPETFEDYSSDDEESEDEVGNVIPPSGTSFPVGRYCYERSEITHSFWHWKKGLRTALENILTQMGVFDEDAVKKVEGMKRKERWKWVDSKLEDLEKGGDVDLLWDMFNAQMKGAEEFMGRPKRYFLAR